MYVSWLLRPDFSVCIVRYTLTFRRELITMAPAFTMGLWGLSGKQIKFTNCQRDIMTDSVRTADAMFLRGEEIH